MAWMASNIYIKTDEQATVVAGMEGVLASGEHRRDLEGILDPPAPLLVTPVHGGWVAVTRAGGWLDDLVWAAEQLSGVTGALVASLEIIGNSYRLRRSEHVAGQRRLLQRTPDHGWDDDVQDPPAMPRYEDCERRAFEELGELGVPPVLITIGTSPLGYPAQPDRKLGLAVELSPDGDQVRRQEADCWVADFAGEDPPVVPTNISRDFGLMAFEERYVEGQPGVEALDRLLELEEGLRLRTRRAEPDAEVSLTVTYNGSVNQERLDELLRQRDRATLSDEQRMRPPWWAFWRHFGRFH